MAGVYVSWPFCGQKCTFCNFSSGVFAAEMERDYAAALAGELARFEWPWRPETVYLGGGTPSRMAAETLERLLDAIPGRPWREATIEAAPGTVTEERARLWARLGIDRVSLGVQSFVPREIAQAGRKHTPETVAGE
ncbi:MAG: radical SAM protein, partial [Acidobacteria bacterium]|nr:radical SAM protein [Acidobacteriota bacterium]